MSQNAVSAKSARIKKLVTLAMLTAVTYVVMLLCKSIPDVAGFLQLEVKDTVICIGGFIYGPVSAAVIAVVVAVIEMLTVSGTGPIGKVTVRPGDIIFGDIDGVLCIPREIAYDVLLRAEGIERNEIDIFSWVRQGDTISEIIDKGGYF